MEYNTIENFLPQSMQDYIEYYMLNTVYGLMDEGSGQQDDFDKNNKNIISSPQLVHPIFDNETGPMDNIFAEICKPILWCFEKETGLILTEVSRIKANMLININSSENQYNPPHVDTPDTNSYSMVYYVNESDGDTRIFNKCAHQGYNDLELIYSNSPKKGTALLFKSNRYHSSSNPIKYDKRNIINFVFKAEKK